MGFPCGSAGKESACNAEDLGSIPGLGKCPGEGKGYPLWYSGLENSMDCIVHEVAKSWTQLSDFHFQLTDNLLKSENHYFYLTCNIGFSVNKSPEIIRTMIIFIGKIRKYSSFSITFLEINFKRNVKALKWHHQNPQCSSFPLYFN